MKYTEESNKIQMKYILLILLFFSIVELTAQNNTDIKFIGHLINIGDYNEALFLIDSDDFENDSIHFFKGWAYYSIKSLELSTNSLLKVSPQSDFYFQSRFFAGYNCAYLSDYKQSQNIFSQIKSDQKIIETLRDFQLSGIDLLNYQFNEAEKKWENMDINNSVIFQPLNDLKNITAELKSHRSKSPLMAGLMSAIVPGLGKVYAGKTGEGIAAFVSTIGFGFMTWENYRKLGPKNIKTIALGSAFAANYFSTIYGSAITAKIIENDYQNAMHNQILFNLHIPLRNYFE